MAPTCVHAHLQPKYDDEDDDGVDEAEEGPNPSAGGPGVTIPGTKGKKVRSKPGLNRKSVLGG